MFWRLLWRPGSMAVIGLLVGLPLGAFAATYCDLGSLYGTSTRFTFRGYAYEEGTLNKPIQGASVTCSVIGSSADGRADWVRATKVATDANGFWECEVGVGRESWSRGESWSIRVSLPAGDARQFSRVEAPGPYISSGQEVIYQSVRGLANPAEIKLYFKPLPVGCIVLDTNEYR